MKKPKIAVCDDEFLIQLWMKEHLEEEGYRVETAGDGAGLMELVEGGALDLVLLDLRLPDGSGLDLLPRIREADPSLPVIMVTAYGEVETAVRAVRSGAYHFLEKPVELSELLLLVEQALQARELHLELDRYREGYRWQFRDVSLVGRSLALQRVAELVTRLARQATPANVLIRGESGTGKDVVARAIHAQGPRSDRPLIRLNCSAIPESLVESELFGHEKGAFTDARDAKRGLFELADGGTLLLDEVGDMPVPAQAKLLGVLETRAFRRVGGTRDIEVDVHVLAATNRNLKSAVASGDFREDLFYRLDVVRVELPPLRERREDIAPLALHFVDTLSEEMRQPRRDLAPEALTVLERHDWPGNARELRNVLERALLLSDEDPIGPSALPDAFGSGEDGKGEPPRKVVLPPTGLDLEEVERELICQALERTDGNKTGAARLLGISRDTLRYRLEKHGIEV